MQTTSPSAAGRPRSDLNATVFAATLRTVRDLGYGGATMDRIAAAAGIAKTTIYRRWPSKGALIVDCLLDAFGPAELESDDRTQILTSMIRLAADKIAEPGVGAAFAGVFVDAVNDTNLREILATRFQEPYLVVLREALHEPDERVLLLIDTVVGTLLHRMGMTGEPMAERDIESLTDMVLRTFG